MFVNDDVKKLFNKNRALLIPKKDKDELELLIVKLNDSFMDIIERSDRKGVLE